MLLFGALVAALILIGIIVAVVVGTPPHASLHYGNPG